MMSHAKGILIVGCVLLCGLALMAQRSSVPARARPGQEPSAEVTAENGLALVEAFVVEVNLAALAELGVSPIGQEPHAVSVADILKCLGSGQARVTAGAKAASQLRGETRVRATARTYIKRTRGEPPQTDYSPHESGQTFSTTVTPLSDAAGPIAVQFSYAHTSFAEKEETTDAPPHSATWDWSGSVVLSPGVPQIAAATQDGDTAVFLLLTAHIAGK